MAGRNFLRIKSVDEQDGVVLTNDDWQDFVLLDVVDVQINMDPAEVRTYIITVEDPSKKIKVLTDDED